MPKQSALKDPRPKSIQLISKGKIIKVKSLDEIIWKMEEAIVLYLPFYGMAFHLDLNCAYSTHFNSYSGQEHFYATGRLIKGRINGKPYFPCPACVIKHFEIED